MSRSPLQLSRRKFLRSSAFGATAAAGLLQAPAILRAQGGGVKIGVLHPVSGALSYSGQQGRLGATMAIDDVNASGGIKALGAAKFDPKSDRWTRITLYQGAPVIEELADPQADDWAFPSFPVKRI